VVMLMMMEVERARGAAGISLGTRDRAECRGLGVGERSRESGAKSWLKGLGNAACVCVHTEN